MFNETAITNKFEYPLEDMLIVVTVKTVNVLLSLEDGGDALVLFLFYYVSAKKQSTNQVWATKSFCMKAMGWGEVRFIKAKGVLEKYKLIEIIKGKKVNDKWYVKLNYIKSNSPENKVVQSGAKNPQNDALRFRGTNALSKDSLNALTNTNVLDSRPKVSCPLMTSSLKEKYPKGHVECVEYVTSFNFVNKPKQFKVLHQILRSGLDFDDIDRLIWKIEKKPYFKENGWDFATIAAEADRSSNAKA